MNRIFDEKLKNMHMIFFELLPFFQNFGPLKFCNYDIPI